MSEYCKCKVCRLILLRKESWKHYHIGDFEDLKSCEWNGKEPDEHGCLDCNCGEHTHSWEEMVRHLRDGMSAGERANPELVIKIQELKWQQHLE